MDLGLWSYATSARDERYIVREGKKAGISAQAAGKLEEAMERVQNGTVRKGEVGKVRGDILELRVKQDKRWYRLLFARHGEGYVALLLGAKKQNTMDEGWIETAAERLGDHRKRQGPK